MIAPANRRSRTLLATVGAILLLGGPATLAAQEAVTTPKTHTVKRGDTLWDLAATYLGDAFRWPELYRLNTDIIDDPHWIYPDEIIKLPGYVAEPTPGLVEPGRPTVEVEPPTAISVDSTQRPVELRQPTLFARGRALPVEPVAGPVDSTPRAVEVTRPPLAVRYGDYIRAPYLERLRGPTVRGRIIGSADIPGIDPARQRGLFQLNDRVLVAPPTGSVAPEGELFLTYQYGPRLEEVGQVIVPTGVVEIIRPPINGEAAIARVVRMFAEVSERDRLMPFDSSVLAATGLPTPIKGGREGEVWWIANEPVLPAPTYYLILSLNTGDGVKTGDEVELYRERQKARDEGAFAIPEIHVGRAQIIRVTPFGSTAMITRLEQPKVEQGTRVRVVAKMQ